LTVLPVDSSVFIGHCGTVYSSKSVFQVQQGGWPLGKRVSLKSDICSKQIDIHLLIYLLVATSFTGESNNQLSSSLNIEQKSEIKKILTFRWPLI